MFGKSKAAERQAEPSFHGWTERQLNRLEMVLSSSRPSFSVALHGFSQTYGRNVMDPHNPASESELHGSLEAFRTTTEGRIDIEPIGTVGHIAFAGHGTDEEGWTPRATFQLAVLNTEQEMRLQQQLHAAFAAKLIPTVALFLESGLDVSERIREIKEEGGCDGIPLRSFRMTAEFGRADL